MVCCRMQYAIPPHSILVLLHTQQECPNGPLNAVQKSSKVNFREVLATLHPIIPSYNGNSSNSKGLINRGKFWIKKTVCISGL